MQVLPIDTIPFEDEPAMLGVGLESTKVVETDETAPYGRPHTIDLFNPIIMTALHLTFGDVKHGKPVTRVSVFGHGEIFAHEL